MILLAGPPIAFVCSSRSSRPWTAAPGRVDLAVEVPLPDPPARRRLITLYARELPFGPEALDRAASRANGTTTSFAKELVRRT